MRVLGIDLGSKRIGVAMSDVGQIMASPHSVIRRSNKAADHRSIAEIVAEYEIERVIVGLPLSLDGSVGRAAKAALAEARALGVVTGVPVETYDERLTTVSAHQILRDQGVDGRDRKDVVDKVAAAVLLQAWLDGQGRTGQNSQAEPPAPVHRPDST
jgi:putative holliday junction resolvase